jgi:2-methylfumaryl-CoA hydratase
MTKSSRGNFLEDFRPGQVIHHAVPRTITAGDVSLYSALYGMRFALQSSDAFARSVRLPCAPVDALLLFHVIFGKSVPDISLNAVANLGYAECRFLHPAFPGDSFTARSEVIGLRANSNGQTGIVHVRTTGTNQHGRDVLTFVRWVMVARRDPGGPFPAPVSPALQDHVAVRDLAVPAALHLEGHDFRLAGSPFGMNAFQVGERIDHMTVEEAEHQIATRLYQNTARGHFDRRLQEESRFGRRIVYGGHVMSLARALSFNGLQNAFCIAAINGGRHLNPLAAGDTVYCWSQVLDCQPVPGRDDTGAIRLRTVATRDLPCAAFPAPGGPDAAQVVLDLDYWALMPRGSARSAKC